MKSYLIAVSAVIPSLLLVWYFYARDVHREPGKVIWMTFLLGNLAVFPVLALVWPIDQLLSQLSNSYTQGFSIAFLSAAVPEELCKLLVLLAYSIRRREFDEPMDGIVYGAVASLGFATLENIFYVLRGGISVAIVRAFTAVPFHAFVGAILGYYVGQSRFSPDKKLRYILKGLGAAILLHGLYDFPIMTIKALDRGLSEASSSTGVATFLGLSAILVLILQGQWTLRLVHRLQHRQLAEIGSSAESLILLQKTHRQNRTGRWIQLLLGGILASVGGMFTLAIILGFILGNSLLNHNVTLFSAYLALGIVPLGFGLFLFIRAILRLSSSSA